MKKISILAVDDNYDFRTLIELYANRTDNMEVIGTANDGLEALDKIIELQPDLVLLDLIMPNLDGIGVLERMQNIQFKKKPMVIVLSALGQDMLIRKALSYGIEYYFVKPLEIACLFKRICHLFEDECSSEKVNEDYIESDVLIDNSNNNITKRSIAYNNLEVEVTNLICEAGIPPHMIGYRYLREAIIYAIKTSKPFTSITKEIYPAIAEMFSTTPQKVERGIRNCIEKAWIRSNQDTIDSLLGYTGSNSKSKLTNSEFIAMISEKVRILHKNI
jgi:two-component system response regulator (stage 0 sporulation protein A)